MQAIALGPDARCLLFEHGIVLQCKLGGDLAQAVDVVREAELVQLTDPGRVRHREPETKTGEPKFRQGPHHQKVGKLPQAMQKRLVCKWLIGLVHHHQPRRGGDHRLDVLGREKIAGGIVGVGQERERRLVSFDCRQHRVAIEVEAVGTQRHGHELPAQRGAEHAVHDEGGLRGHHHPFGASQAQHQQLDDLVGAVAEQQSAVGRDGQPLAQRELETAPAGIGVAVHVHPT